MQGRTVLVPMALAFLGLACTDQPTDLEVTPEFNVQRGNPYPGVDLLWIIGGLSQAAPNVSRAANGHTIDVRGIGPFTTQPHATVGVNVSSFVWKDASGNVVASGTWTPTRFISFHTYNLEVLIPIPFPPFSAFLIGGKLTMEVELSSGHTGILEIDCLIGDFPEHKALMARGGVFPDDLPAGKLGGAGEGMQLSLRGGPNFSKILRGGTVYVRFPS